MMGSVTAPWFGGTRYRMFLSPFSQGQALWVTRDKKNCLVLIKNLVLFISVTGGNSMTPSAVPSSIILSSICIAKRIQNIWTKGQLT